MNIASDKLQQAIAEALNAKLALFLHEPLNRTTCIAIYSKIFETIQEIVLNVPQLSGVLSNDAINFIAQAYYDMLTVNDTQELDPKIFTQRVFPFSLTTPELQVLTVLLRNTPIAAELVATLKKRS